MLLTRAFLETFAEIALSDDDDLAKSEPGVVRVPRGDDGKPDYRSLTPGQRAWVTLDHPDSALRGRVVLVERTPDGFIMVDNPRTPPGHRLPPEAHQRYRDALREAEEQKRREEEEEATQTEQAEGLFARHLPTEAHPPLAVGADPDHDIPTHSKPE
jgi:hypothetical protein